MSVLFKLGGLGEALEGLVYGLQPDPARREQIPNFTEERLGTGSRILSSPPER